MNFVDKADKPSAAIADAIDEGSSSSSEEYVEGPPLEVEAVKKKQEEEVRKQKEAEIREQEEKARQLKEAQEQEEKEREEARKKEEEEKRHEKKRDDEDAQWWRKEQRKEDEEARRRREERKRQEAKVRRRRERLWDEEEYARRRFEERRRDEEDEIRRLKQEQRRLDQTNALRQLEQESQSLEEQEAAAKEETSVSEKAGLFSPMTKHIMEVVSNLGKNSTKTERPATVEASTETDNDLFYQRPEQVPMRSQEVQAGPVKQPVASYLIKRPRSEARLQRLLSFFGLASPEELEQEVIDARRFEDTPTIHSEPNLEDERHAREDTEARIRAEEEVRILTCKLRLLEADRYEGESRFDELREEEEALQLERDMLQVELDRLKEHWQANKWQRRHDQGLTQLSRIEERLRLLEQGQHFSKKGTPWTTLAELPATVPSFYLCDSEYCTQEGNFLKSLLSEADYPCEDFYEHICLRWTQRRSAEATRRGTISEDVFLEDRMERILLSSFEDNAAAVKPAVKFMRICKNSASSSSVHEVREVFKHWRIRDWPVRSYEARHREDAWFFAGELLRDMGLPVLADVYVAVDPFNERKGVTTLKPPEPLHFPRDTVPDLVDRAVKEALRSFNINDPSHIERLADEVLVVFDVVEHLAGDKPNSTMVKDCELDHDIIKLLSTAVEYNSNRTGSITCRGATHVQLFSAKYFEKLPEELRRVAGNALLNHLGFRALVRLAAFMPDSLHALRELSYLEITGRSEVPDVDNLCLRAMEEILPLCLVKAAALPLIHNGVALWQRRWLSDLEFTFLHALPRVPWLDERALFALAFRLRQIRVDLPFSIDQFQENDECLPGDLKVGNKVTDILRLFRELRTRRTILELRSGPEWRPLSPLKMWPYFDATLRRVRIPQGLLNNSVPANSSIFAFHLSRVAVRYYATMASLLYASFEYDGEATLDFGHESKRLFEVVQRCLEEDWRALSELEAAGLPTQYGLLDHRAWWLRRWLLGQTLAIEMALHAFRELLDVRRIRKLQYRFVTLPDYTSTQLFFMYYALDHCEKDYEGFERRQFLQRKRPPAKMRVNLPLRHVEAFANAFGCRRGDQMRADQQCTTFLH
ncbi:hypothetical protein HPB52_007220 [Rhipicephalus sanguineus]|uniref:Uncharacterized protein n=1 Tax=Rhipicephalus sanguineus TaxID=34632 RepID=A0A9D4PRZ4_RHISA|nr:hypothetical protein HPB52_007220 [Rhipicephalus sanguineus]